MDPNLERARDELSAAADEAGRVVQTQLHSIDEGIFEEEAGDKTQAEPGPKPDRLAEILQKLERLQAEAKSEQTERRIEATEAAIREYMREHPQGGETAP